MIRKLLHVTPFLLLFIGCDNFYMICSLNPFYVENKVILLPSVEGSWSAKPIKSAQAPANASNPGVWGIADTTSAWTIRRFVSKNVVKSKKGEDSTTLKPENFYITRLLKCSDSVRYEFKVVLFRVKGDLYADFIPFAKEELLKSKLSSNSFFEVHTLARISMKDDQLELSWLGADCMKEMIEKKRVRTNYLWVKATGRFVLTATSEELNAMIVRYADQPRFIDWNSQQARLKLNRIN